MSVDRASKQRKCPACGSARVWKKGYTPTRSMGLKPRYVCFECGKTFYVELPPQPVKPKAKKPKTKKKGSKK